MVGRVIVNNPKKMFENFMATGECNSFTHKQKKGGEIIPNHIVKNKAKKYFSGCDEDECLRLLYNERSSDSEFGSMIENIIYRIERGDDEIYAWDVAHYLYGDQSLSATEFTFEYIHEMLNELKMDSLFTYSVYRTHDLTISELRQAIEYKDHSCWENWIQYEPDYEPTRAYILGFHLQFNSESNRKNALRYFKIMMEIFNKVYEKVGEEEDEEERRSEERRQERRRQEQEEERRREEQEEEQENDEPTMKPVEEYIEKDDDEELCDEDPSA
jgi:hypothetical protein